jgi:signal peptidase I
MRLGTVCAKEADLIMSEEIFKDNDKHNGKDVKESEEDGKKKKQSPLDETLDWIESFVFAIFIVLLVFIFLFRTVVVDGNSMNPTLLNEQRLILTHFNYTPKRGDIIVANSQGLQKTIIKRCIGVAGDTVVIDYADNSVTVNGEKLDETYLGEEMVQREYYDTTYQISDTAYEYNVPEGCIFALGDNRNDSRDSRDASVGFISCEDVLGKATLRFYPIETFKKL